jgi:SET domain-containing protein
MAKKSATSSKRQSSKNVALERKAAAATASDLRKNPKLPYYVAVSPLDGLGVFAARAIKNGECIGEYEGPAATKNGKYVLWTFEDDGSVYAARSGKNGLRYLNHSRKNNAEFIDFKLYALKKIAADEEICFDYGDPDSDFY